MNPENKRYILEHIGKKSIKEIAGDLHLKERRVRHFLEREREEGGTKSSAPADKPKPKVKKSFIVLSCIIIALLGTLVYVNSIHGKFLLDDDLILTDNAYIKNFIYVPTVFTSDMGKGIGLQSHYYRPLQILVHMVEYHFWKFQVEPYHIVNIIFHIFMALAVFWMVNVLFRDTILALFTTAMWAVHPIHPEVVAYISGTGDCMAGAFIILTFILYVKAVNGRNPLMFILPIATYVIAVFTKETSLSLLGLPLLYHYAFKKKLKVAPFLLFVVITAVYVMFRVSLMRDIVSQTSALSAVGRMPGFFVAISGYVKMLAAPFDLYMGHESKLFSWADPGALLGMLIVGALVATAIIVRRRSNLVTFAIGWFFIALAPVSNLYPLTFYMADHYLHLPSIGFFLIVAQGLRSLYEKAAFRILAVACVVAIVVSFGFLTIKQNDYWHDPVSFYERTLRYEPTNVRTYVNLANQYAARNRMGDAVAMYKRAILLNPAFADAHHNYGVALDKLGKHEEAIAELNKAIELNPRYANAYNMLGFIYWTLGKGDEAIPYYEKGLEVAPYDVRGMCNLAVAYYTTGSRDKAVALLNKAVRLNPDYFMGYSNLGAIYIDMGKPEEAIPLCLKALELNPNEANIYSNLGRAYYKMGREKEAVEYIKKALEIDPSHKNAKANLEAIMSQSKDMPGKN